MQDVAWLYRVLENDDDGDPLDFGAVSGFSEGSSARKLFHHLKVDLGLSVTLPLRVYVVKYPGGVWKSDGWHEEIRTIGDLKRVAARS